MKLRVSLAVAFAAFIPSIQAGSLAPACSGLSLATLRDYVSLSGDACSVGILNYSKFFFLSGGTGGASLLTASQIDLTPAPGGSLGGGFTISAAPGFDFSVAAGQMATYSLFWYFEIDPGPVGQGGDLNMDPPFGNSTITQTYCADSPFGDAGCPTGNQTLKVSTIPLKLSDSIVFNPPIQNFAYVETTITLVGSAAGGSGFDAIVSSPTIAVAGPEPATSMLCLAGFVVALIARRRGTAQ